MRIVLILDGLHSFSIAIMTTNMKTLPVASLVRQKWRNRWKLARRLSWT